LVLTIQEQRTTPVTVPEPFTLATEKRGDRHQERFKRKLDKWKRIDREHAFKALPVPTYPDLFIPSKSTRPLTRPENVVLHTDKRSEERRALEVEREGNYRILQEMRAQEAREQEVSYKGCLLCLVSLPFLTIFLSLSLHCQLRDERERRQASVSHAGPIRHYSPIDIRRSTRPLTVPKSPNIGEKRRRLMQEIEERQHAYEDPHEGPHDSHAYNYVPGEGYEYPDELIRGIENRQQPHEDLLNTQAAFGLEDGYHDQEDHDGAPHPDSEPEYVRVEDQGVDAGEEGVEYDEVERGHWVQSRSGRHKRPRMEVADEDWS